MVPQKVPQQGDTKENEVDTYFQTLNQPYYLVPRRGKRKKTVFYYRIIDQDRRVVGEWSTHCTRKQDAFRYSERLRNEDRLVPTVMHRPGPTNPSLFKEYFADWFIWEKGEDIPKCPYIQKRLKRGKRYSPSNTQIQ